MKRVEQTDHNGNPQDDPVVAFLAFIERDMTENPTSIQPLSSDLLNRVERLVENMTVDLNERID